MTSQELLNLKELRCKMLESYVTLIEMEYTNPGFKEAAEKDLLSAVTWLDIWIKELDKRELSVVS